MGQCPHLDIAKDTEAPISSAEHSSQIDTESGVDAMGGIVCNGRHCMHWLIYTFDNSRKELLCLFLGADEKIEPGREKVSCLKL